MANSLYSLTEAAKLLQCHVETLRRAIRKGTLKAARVGRQYKISKQDLESFYAELGGGVLGNKLNDKVRDKYNYHELLHEVDEHLTFLRDMVAGYKVSIGFGGGLAWRNGIGIKELNRMEAELDQALNKLAEGHAKLGWFEMEKKHRKKKRHIESSEPRENDEALAVIGKIASLLDDPEKLKALHNFITEQTGTIKPEAEEETDEERGTNE